MTHQEEKVRYIQSAINRVMEEIKRLTETKCKLQLEYMDALGLDDDFIEESIVSQGRSRNECPSTMVSTGRGA